MLEQAPNLFEKHAFLRESAYRPTFYVRVRPADHAGHPLPEMCNIGTVARNATGSCFKCSKQVRPVGCPKTLLVGRYRQFVPITDGTFPECSVLGSPYTFAHLLVREPSKSTGTGRQHFKHNMLEMLFGSVSNVYPYGTCDRPRPVAVRSHVGNV